MFSAVGALAQPALIALFIKIFDKKAVGAVIKDFSEGGVLLGLKSLLQNLTGFGDDLMIWGTNLIGDFCKLFGQGSTFDNALLGTGSTIKALGSAITASGGTIAVAIGLIVAAIASLTSSYGGLGGVIERVGKVFGDAIKGMKDFANSIGFSDKIDKLKKSLSNMVEPLKKLYDALGKLKPVWEVVFVTLSAVIEVALNAIVAAVGALVDVIGGLADIIGGALDVVVGIVTLDGELIVKGFKLMGEGIVGVFQGL